MTAECTFRLRLVLSVGGLFPFFAPQPQTNPQEQGRGADVDGMKAEIPEAMIENRSNESVREFDYRLRSQGMDLETYLKYTGTNVEEFQKTFRPQSEKQVKMRLALEKIVELEGLTATEEEISAEYEKVAANYGIEAERVKASIPEKDIIHDIALNKAVDLVKASAVITDVEKKTEKEEKKAPAKKPAAKKTAAKKTTKKAETEEKAEDAE